MVQPAMHAPLAKVFSLTFGKLNFFKCTYFIYLEFLYSLVNIVQAILEFMGGILRVEHIRRIDGVKKEGQIETVPLMEIFQFHM